MIIVLTGPTGTGKSKMAISLAKKLGAAIINADAFQVYRELSIATAKPTDDMMMEAPHFLYDFVPLTEDYNVAEYQKDLRANIAMLQQTETPIIIAGGTGLYIRAGLYDYEFKDTPPVDLSKYEGLTNDQLHEVLKAIDPKSAEEIHPNNRIRVMRAISIHESLGVRKSDIVDAQKHQPIYDDLFFFGLTKNRAEIYADVEKRVDEMFDRGLVEENRALVDKYGREPHAFRAIGVKELFPYFDGLITLEDAKNQIKQNTRNYVKRQLTFFNHQFPITFIEKEEEILNLINH